MHIRATCIKQLTAAKYEKSSTVLQQADLIPHPKLFKSRALLYGRTSIIAYSQVFVDLVLTLKLMVVLLSKQFFHFS